MPSTMAIPHAAVQHDHRPLRNRTAFNELVGERTRRYVAGELARSP